MVLDACAQYGMRRVPDAYVVLGNGMINAAASGHGFRRFVFVYSDLFEIGGQARDPEALRFIIGHEVGHIAAGHASYWRLLAISGAQWIPFLGSTLSRSQEYTADNFGYALVPHGSAGAMATLAAGKYLNRTVDVNALADRAFTEKGFFVWVGQRPGEPPGAGLADERAARPPSPRPAAVAATPAARDESADAFFALICPILDTSLPRRFVA